jgi:hypothetical protein
MYASQILPILRNRASMLPVVTKTRSKFDVANYLSLSEWLSKEGF